MSLSTGASAASLRYSISPLVTSTSAPPIPIARAWATAYSRNPTHGPLVDLSQGVPGTAPHQSVLEAISKLALDPSVAKYGPILGEPSLREALSVELNHLYDCSSRVEVNGDAQPGRLGDPAGSGISPADVSISTGCNMAMMALIMSLCPPGSGVMLPCPAYFNYAMAMSLQGVKPIWVPSDQDVAFEPSIDYARLYLESDRLARTRPTDDAAGSEAGPEPRMIMLTTPSNPTGTTMPHETLRKWYDLAKEYGIALVLDETYRDFVVKDTEGADETKRGIPHTLFDLPDWRDTLVSLGSFSKSYRIPGYRLGSITAHPALLDKVLTICDCMQICAPRLPQLALPPLLPSLRPDLLSSARALTSLRALFAEVLNTVPGWTIAAGGAYFAYVSFPADYIHASSALGLKRRRLGSMEIAKELAERFGVVCLPGRFFEPDLEEVEEEQGRLIRSAPNQGPGAGIATAHGNGGMGGQKRDWWGKLKEDRWLRFAVANVDEDTIRALGPRLREMNRLTGMEES